MWCVYTHVPVYGCTTCSDVWCRNPKADVRKLFFIVLYLTHSCWISQSNSELTVICSLAGSMLALGITRFLPGKLELWIAMLTQISRDPYFSHYIRLFILEMLCHIFLLIWNNIHLFFLFPSKNLKPISCYFLGLLCFTSSPISSTLYMCELRN